MKRLMVAMTLGFLTLSGVGVAADKTVPGERWQQKMSIQMAGMTMPGSSSEICAPVGRADEQLLKPEKNCKVSNVNRSGNRLSADVACTGKDAISGNMVLVTEGNTVKGTMQARMEGETVTMVMESTKLGSCQAIDTEALVADAQAAGARAAAAAPKVDMCGTSVADLVKKDAANAGAAAMMFLGDKAQCAGKPMPAEACSAVQTRKGFGGLANIESLNKGMTVKMLGACGLGQGQAAVETLRARLVKAAEADGDGDFIIANAPARAKQLARSECVIKGEMWGGKSARWDSFCDSNFADEARNGR